MHSRGGAAALDEATKNHQRLFHETYPNSVKPKHHLRMHLATQYQRLGYYDTWAQEKKHGVYKKALANSTGHLFHERDGKLSHQILGRMLHMTVEAQSQESHFNPELCGRIYSADNVLRVSGFHCPVSTKMSTGKGTLRVDDVIFWDPSSAAMILFFVHYKYYKDTFVMLLKDLQELPYDNPHGRKFSLLQSTQALCLDDAINLRCPTWWTIEDGNVICLL